MLAGANSATFIHLATDVKAGIFLSAEIEFTDPAEPDLSFLFDGVPLVAERWGVIHSLRRQDFSWIEIVQVLFPHIRRVVAELEGALASGGLWGKCSLRGVSGVRIKIEAVGPQGGLPYPFYSPRFAPPKPH
jgi:hypothetical protein